MQTAPWYTLFIKEKKEQRSYDQKAGYVQYIWDDSKGLKHNLHFYQVFLHSFLFYPLPSLFAGLYSVVNITAYDDQPLYDQKINISLYYQRGSRQLCLRLCIASVFMRNVFTNPELLHMETEEMQCLSSSNAQHLF